MAEAGKKPKAGQELRLVDLPADVHLVSVNIAARKRD